MSSIALHPRRVRRRWVDALKRSPREERGEERIERKKKGKKEEREKGKKSDIACGNSDIGLDLGSSSDLCDIFTIRREFLSLRIGKIIGTIPVRNATPPSRRRINPFVYRDLSKIALP